MSRDIKFRLYDKENGEMEYLENADIFRLLKAYPTRYELMQYTGVKDKNNQEIYEGDILYYREEESVYEVKWFFDCWSGNGYPIGISISDRYEVIGNTLEDPELMTPPQNLDDAINLFKGYMANENHFDEIDFKTWLYDVWLVEEKKK